MGIIVYGTQQAAIGFEEFYIKCPSCEANSWADVGVMSKYYHFYFVPIFPFEKEANIICQTCGLKRYGRAFDATLVSNYNEVKRKFRHPLFTYTGLGILVFIILVSVILAIFK